MTKKLQNSDVKVAIELVPQTFKNETLQLENTENFAIEDEETLMSISQIKRFLERYQADPDFRDQIFTEPYKAINRYNLKVDPQEIRSLWDTEFDKSFPRKVPNSISFKHYLEFTEKFKTLESVKSVIETLVSEPRYKLWRERQIARTTSQFKKSIHDSLIHAPVCFELSKGCSVGCWFCGVSAPRLGDIFFYSPENAKLWREVLEVMKEILGATAGAGFCYWATDPFDNPDYEQFCSDFHEILGMFPQTTTAQALKDPARTRALLKLSKEKGCPLNRFSILSLKILDRVHEEFSAEELAFVSLVLQNQEANQIKAKAGRARERSLNKGEEDSEFPEQGTIACVTGFLFNMVERSVKLISPCNANDRWPLGYIVYDQGTFSDANELKTLLQKMIDDNMPLTVRPNQLINFRGDLKYQSLEDGFQLFTKFKTFNFRHDADLRELGEVIHNGGKTAQEIADKFEVCGISPAYTFHHLNLMLEKGILDDEPKPNVKLS